MKDLATLPILISSSEKFLLLRTMTGRGKGGKGLGKGGAKRHRKVLRDNIQVRLRVFVLYSLIIP